MAGKYQSEVYKFGGASLRHAEAIRRVVAIIKECKSPLLIVVSAMGKTTNALEVLADRLFRRQPADESIRQLSTYHTDILRDLMPNHPSILQEVQHEIEQWGTEVPATEVFDEFYDHIVCRGELLSSRILAAYLESTGQSILLADARDYVVTDNNFRAGRVDWPSTLQRISSLKSILAERTIITQGFIGRDPVGHSVTLGRDGSDYSAAIFASGLSAGAVTIWKDVPGVMNADPKRLPDAVVFDELPFAEAAEMTYYGASVIHPKTIKPLANRNIPLLVKNFDDPEQPGTLIHETRVERLPPLIVFKENQCLISCRVTDYTFINEHQLGQIFQILSTSDVHINVMQNSAISFSFCVDYREEKIRKLIDTLAKEFEVYYNTGLTLITVKNYDAKTYQEYRNRPGVILEQSSRSTLQVLVRP